jgi:2-oxoacid:acceptor oxidoreductase gamma subunit (pyruvate/2-ketoisovalerate family)
MAFFCAWMLISGLDADENPFWKRETVMKEIIWFGRGGQGAVVAAQILAESAYLEGFKGVTSAPTFGPERRGAPVTASTRISEDPNRMFSQVEMADIAIVLDDTLLGVVDVKGRIRKGGTIIINTSCKPEDAAISGDFDVATVDATGIALKLRLLKEGAPVINTPLLGAFAKARGSYPWRTSRRPFAASSRDGGLAELRDGAGGLRGTVTRKLKDKANKEAEQG